MATRYGNFGLTFTPSTGVDPGLDQNPGWMQLFADNLARLPAVQAIEQAREMMLPSDPNYGLTADSLKGYEEYAESFLEVRSQAQEDALKARIDKNRERIDRIDEYGSFSSMLAAEALNPINLVPLPLVRGAGFIKGMLRSGAALGGTLTAEELLRHGVDPTATTEESIDNVVYGTLFGAAIGGLIGKVGAKDIQDLATQYSKWRRVENDEIADVVDEQAPIIGSETGFTAKPTGGVATGPAPAFGLEAVTRMTLAGKLKSSGIRAVEDLVDAMAGTMGYMNAKNLQKIPTETSAYLASKAWNGAGVAAIERLRRVYVEYLGGSKPMEVLGLNIPVIKSQIGDVLRRGGGRPDGKMTYEEFKDAVFRAHKPDRIEADDDFVRRGAEVIRPFYEKALNEGSEWGSIPSQKGIRRKLQNKTKRMRDMTTRYEELAAKGERSINEQLEMNLMEAELRRTLEMFEMLERRLIDSEALGKRIEDIEASVKTAAKETLGDMAAKIEERMVADQAILADLEGQIASGKQLTERQQFLVELLKARLGIVNEGYESLNLIERPSSIGGVKIVYGPTGKRAMATYRRNENTVYFDLDGILASWEQKPWRDPKVKGVFALDDADFPTPEAWAEFNMRHELAHSRVDRFNKSKLNIYPSDNKVARLFALPDGRFTDDFDLAREAAGNVNDVRYVDVFARGKEPVDNAVSRRFDTAEDGTFRSKGGELKLRGFTTDVKAQYENAMNAIALNEMRKGITPAQRSLIEKLDLTIQNPREGMTAKQLAYVDKLEDMIARGAFDGDFEGPKNGVPYLNRHWLIDRVNENEADLRVILADWFTKNPLPGASMTPDAISKRVDDAIASIRKEASADDLPVAMGMGGPSFTMGRKLDIPNELVADFIETDVERLIRTYANRFGLVHEYTRAFGEFSAEDAIGDTMLQAAREIKADSVTDGLAQLRSLEADIVRLRDYQTGAVYSVDPLMLNKRRLAANLKAYGTLTTMGRAAYSAIGEAARPLMVHGFGRTFGFAFDALIKGMDRGKAVTQEMAELTGDIADVALSSTFQRFVEMGGPTGAPTTKVGRGAEKMTRFAQGPYFILNGLALVTDALKRYGLTATSQFMLEDLQKLAAGKGGSKFENVMASYGFTPEDAKAIMAQPIDKAGNVWLPNTGEWADPNLVRKFSTAVTAMNNRLVVTAGPDDIPEIAKGFVKGREYPLLTLPFQFWNFGFAAQNKVALSALQGRDANALGGAAAMIAMGGVVAYLKTPEMVWENMEPEEKLIRSVDQSGLLAIYGDIPTMVETATLGNVSARSMIGLEPYVRNPDYADLLGEVGGPAVGKAADITKLFLDGDVEREEVASTIRRSIPLNDLFYWRDLWRDAEKGLLEATE